MALERHPVLSTIPIGAQGSPSPSPRAKLQPTQLRLPHPPSSEKPQHHPRPLASHALPTPPHTNTAPTPALGAREELVLHDLPQRTKQDLMRESIRRLQRSEWVSLEGLMETACARLGKTECAAISELGRGSHNSLYQLDFSDGSSCAASISNSPPAFFSADAKRSEVATMQYLASSPRYNFPIPKVYAWDFTFSNPVGAPYILREVVRGKNMSEDGRFYMLSAPQKLKVIKELANVQAQLSQPTEFTQLGCIYGDQETGFYVGKLVSLPSGSPEEDERRQEFLGPFDTLPELWEARIERETLSAISNWSALPSDSALPSSLPSSQANPQQFGELLQILSGLTSLFTPPKALEGLCIHHSDLAIRNVLFDPDTLKITGVIDWEFASVMPLVMTGRFPNDLGWEGNEFARSLGKLGEGVGEGETWNHHYYDWTSLSGVAPLKPSSRLPVPGDDCPPSPPASPAFFTEDYLTTTLATRHHDSSTISTPSPPSPPLPPPPTSETSQQDLTSRASNLIRLFYYRKYYASRLAAKNFDLTYLFIDAVAYIKFNEVVMGGAEKWFASAEWIREVWRRLSSVSRDEQARLSRGEGVVRVPEVFEKKPDDKRLLEVGSKPEVVDLSKV